MKNFVLDPLGDLEVTAEGYSNWHITNYPKLPDKIYSPEFECGGYKWSLLSSPCLNTADIQAHSILPLGK